jgi:hypothetical protein
MLKQISILTIKKLMFPFIRLTQNPLKPARSTGCAQLDALNWMRSTGCAQLDALNWMRSTGCAQLGALKPGALNWMRSIGRAQPGALNRARSTRPYSTGKNLIVGANCFRPPLLS